MNNKEYGKLKNFLVKKFEKYDAPKMITDNLSQKSLNQKCLIIGKFGIKIFFPGYKALIDKNGIVKYDYRVELNDIPISHVNIILDLYNKTKQQPQLVKPYYKFLKDVAYHAYNIDYKEYEHLDSYKFESIDPAVVNIVEQEHITLSKTYQKNGNENWSYSIQELANTLSFIVLQEDINYPMPRYQGRKMPFYRYFEALALNDADIDTEYTLEDVVSRTLAKKYRPELFNSLEKKNIYIKNIL